MIVRIRKVVQLLISLIYLLRKIWSRSLVAVNRGFYTYVAVFSSLILVAFIACLQAPVALASLSLTARHPSRVARWSRGQGQGGAHCSSFRSQIDSMRVFLPQALAGYDSQGDPLSDLPSTIPVSLCKPHLAKGAVAQTASALKDIRNVVYTVVSFGTWVDKPTKTTRQQSNRYVFKLQQQVTSLSQ